MRVPDSVAERASRVRAAERELRGQLGREPSTAEVAEALELSTGEVAEARAAGAPVSSLDEPLANSDGLRAVDTLADPDGDEPFGEESDDGRREALESLLGLLPARDRRVLELRFGLGGEPARTADDVAEALGVTRQRVRQIEQRALLRLGQAAGAVELRQAA